MNIDQSAATQLALDFLKRLSNEPEGVPYSLLESRTREDDDGWYFSYQSTSFLQTGNFSESLVGNWPIFVNRKGDYVGPRRPGMPIPSDAV